MRYCILSRQSSIPIVDDSLHGWGRCPQNSPGLLILEACHYSDSSEYQWKKRENCGTMNKLYIGVCYCILFRHSVIPIHVVDDSLHEEDPLKVVHVDCRGLLGVQILTKCSLDFNSRLDFRPLKSKEHLWYPRLYHVLKCSPSPLSDTPPSYPCRLLSAGVVQVVVVLPIFVAGVVPCW